MANDHVPAVFGVSHTEDEGYGMFPWQINAESFCPLTLEDYNILPLPFNGNSELLTLDHAAQGPLESANIASHPSHSDAVGTASSTLTGWLSSTEKSLEKVHTPKGGKDQDPKGVVTENNNPIMWQKGDGPGAKDASWKEFHYYDNEKYKMDATDAESIGNTFPPENVLLSDWWVGKILLSALGGAERGKMWPCDFNSKGYIRTSRSPKGRAYKQLGGSEDAQKWYYMVYSRFQLFGKEGLDAGLIAVRRRTQSTKNILKRGVIAVQQNNDIPSAAKPHKSEINEVEAETFKRGGEYDESNSGSSASTSSEERPRKMLKQ